MDGNEWFRRFVDHFGPFPSSYLVADLETTGLDCHSDLAVQLGWCEVRDRKVVDNAAVVLDWTSYPPMDQQWLQGRLERTRQAMESRGNQYGWTMSVLANGQPPLDVLADLLHRLRAPDALPVVSHNGVMYDAVMLESHFARFLFDDAYEFPDDRHYDTGVLTKGYRAGITPRPHESLGAFSRRVMSVRSRVKWSLSGWCVPELGLDTRYGLHTANAHSAAYDTLATHCLLEHYRAAADGRVVLPAQPVDDVARVRSLA